MSEYCLCTAHGRLREIHGTGTAEFPLLHLLDVNQEQKVRVFLCILAANAAECKPKSCWRLEYVWPYLVLHMQDGHLCFIMARPVAPQR